MAKGIRICKVCGKEYEYCHTVRRDGNMFRWQDVACSPEHGSIYFARILESRANANRKNEPAVPPTDDDEIDDIFEEEFDDGDDELEIETNPK